MLQRTMFTVLLCLMLPLQAVSEVIIRDGDIKISRAEFERIVGQWSSEMRSSAANDLGDRLELISMAVSNSKLAAQADALSPEDDEEAYWDLHFKLLNLKRNFMLKRFVDNLEVPDMSELAKERYNTEKDKYALVPEKRLTSHILWSCPALTCDRTELRPVAAEVLEKLQEGASFTEMVAEHSQDPGSKAKEGLYDTWFSLGQSGIEPHYTGAAFEIENVGDYSPVVDTRFGLHIIRLDGIEERHYRSFDEVKQAIMGDLRAEFIKLSAKAYEVDLRISEDARIAGKAVEEILAPYKTQQ